MEILTFNEIIQFIKKETEGVDMEWKEDVILKPMENPIILIDDLKKSLRIDTIDQNFTHYILKYNWGNFCFLSYQFGYKDESSLNWLIKRNLNYYDFKKLKKAGLIIIANGDPYTIVLEYISGKIYAIDNDSETDYDKKMPIADNFELLVRTMGTGQYAFWNNLQQDFIKLINKIGKKEGMNFWRSLVGYWDTLV